MNKLVLGFCAVSIAFGMVGVTGCQALEAAKNNVVYRTVCCSFGIA